MSSGVESVGPVSSPQELPQSPIGIKIREHANEFLKDSYSYVEGRVDADGKVMDTSEKAQNKTRQSIESAMTWKRHTFGLDHHWGKVWTGDEIGAARRFGHFCVSVLSLIGTITLGWWASPIFHSISQKEMNELVKEEVGKKRAVNMTEAVRHELASLTTDDGIFVTARKLDDTIGEYLFIEDDKLEVKPKLKSEARKEIAKEITAFRDKAITQNKDIIYNHSFQRIEMYLRKLNESIEKPK